MNIAHHKNSYEPILVQWDRIFIEIYILMRFGFPVDGWIPCFDHGTWVFCFLSLCDDGRNGCELHQAEKNFWAVHPHDTQPFPWSQWNPNFPTFLWLKCVEITEKSRPANHSTLYRKVDSADFCNARRPIRFPLRNTCRSLGKWLESSEVSVNGNCSMVKSNVSLNMCLMVNSPL